MVTSHHFNAGGVVAVVLLAPFQSRHSNQGEMDHLSDNATVNSSTMNYNNGNGNGNNNMDNNIGIAAYVQNRLKESAHPPLASFTSSSRLVP
jgi:hypothetical protein